MDKALRIEAAAALAAALLPADGPDLLPLHTFAAAFPEHLRASAEVVALHEAYTAEREAVRAAVRANINRACGVESALDRAEQAQGLTLAAATEALGAREAMLEAELAREREQLAAAQAAIADGQRAIARVAQGLADDDGAGAPIDMEKVRKLASLLT